MIMLIIRSVFFMLRRLLLPGNSGGTAALASLEFNAHEDSIEAHAMGFGTPAVLSRNLSESLLNTVTTVIHDADVVPRMSGVTLANAWIKILQYNWTDDALEDIHQLLPVLKDNVVPPPIADLYCTDERKDQIVDWFRSFLASQIQPVNGLPLPSEPTLMPPGDCIHVYRDGLQWQGNYMPCYRFNEIEIVRSLVDDHLVVPGYYAGLLGFVRALRKDFDWKFDHDPSKLPA
jgi:Lipase (class 3)